MFLGFVERSAQAAAFGIGLGKAGFDLAELGRGRRSACFRFR